MPGGVRLTMTGDLEKSMKRKFERVAAVLAAGVLLAGCAAGRIPTQPKPEDTDQFKIVLAVYGYLLNRHFWDTGEYAAVFLQGDDAEVRALTRQFPGHVPPIKPGYRADLRPNLTLRDKDSGRPAMILSVDTLEATNGVAEAIGRWYAGPAVSGFYTFELKKSGGDWAVESSH